MKFQTRLCIAYWPLGSVLPRPLEILPSFLQCSLSRVTLHLFQASGKPGRQGGIAFRFWCSGTGCQGLHSLKKGWRSPLRIVIHLSPRQTWAGSNLWHWPSASRCPHSLNASISKFLSAPRKPPLLSLQAATDLRSDSAKHLPWPTAAMIFAGYSLQYFHRDDRDPSDFKFSMRIAEAHTTLYLELPNVSRLLPHFNKASYPGVAFPALEGPTLNHFGCSCMQTKRNTVEFSHWNQPPGYGEG